METSFNINQTIRIALLNFLENHSLEQLNAIPEGFSNNLIWNIGHCIVATNVGLQTIRFTYDDFR